MKKYLFLLLLLLITANTSLFGQVTPMIQSEWHTSSPWNQYCPEVLNTDADAGTGALAVSKIMKFWNYPPAGTGTVSYTDDDLGDIYQNLSYTFDWARMSNVLLRQETLTLIRTVGYGIKSDWEIDYTTSELDDIMTALVTHFSYSNSMEMHDLADTSFFVWRQMINNQLSLGRPVLYQGYAEEVDRNYYIIIDGLNEDNRYTYVTSSGDFEHYTTDLTDLVLDGHLVNVNNQKMLINIIPDDINEYDESFENGFTNNNWYFQGNASWTLASNESYEGTQSARPMNIGHNQSSSMLIDLSVPAEDEISFFIKPSCESPTQGQYDRAVFYINGVEQDEWYGVQNWTYASYPLEPGTYQFKWSYIKDGSVVHGDDTVYLDAINLPSGETPLFAPQNLTAQVTGSNTVTLNWEFPEGYQRDLQGYKIYRDFSELTQTFSPSVNTYTDGNVPNGVHYYSVRAIYNSGLSNFSNSAEVDINVLYPPVNLSYQSIGANTVTVSWENSPLLGNDTPDAYKLYLNGEFHSTTTQMQSTINLTEGEHLFYVTAIYDGEESSASAVLSIIIGVLPPPSNLTASLYNGNNVHLEWTPPVTPSITGYQIFRDGQLLTVINNQATTDFDDEDLDNGSYTYTIKTVNGALTSGHSLSASVDIMILQTPINLEANIINNVSTQLTWEYPSAAYLLEQFKVYRNGAVVSSVYNTENPSFFDYNLPNGSYNYQVTAVYDGVESGFSETESVVIDYPYPPRNFTATANGSSVNLAWSSPATQGGPSRGLLRYKIYQDGEFISNIENTNTTSYTINGLENSTYTFAIAAEYNSGLSILIESEVLIEVLYAPQNLAYSIEGHNATIRWEPGSLSRELLQYHLYRNGSEYAITTEPRYEDVDLLNGYYEYSVVAEYDTGFSDPSETISFNLEFPYPIEYLDYTVTDNDITLFWERPVYADNVRSLVSYELFRNDESLGTTNSLTYTDSDLINASYEYYLVVNYTNESSQPSNTQTIDLINQYPVENITFNVQERNNIVLAWSSNTYSGETIESFDILKNGEFLINTNELSYTDQDLDDGEYTYSVIAQYSNGPAQATISETIQIEYPYPVSDFDVSVMEDDILLSWIYPEMGSPIFQIFRNNTFIGQTSDFSYEDQSLANGVYSYQIRTTNNSDSGYSELSPSLNAEISVTYPVTGLLANVVENSIELTWDAPVTSSRALEGYKVFVNGELYSETITETAYTLTELSNGTYSIYIVATYTNGDSEPSNTATVDVEVRYSPINFTLNTSDNSVELMWESPADAVGIINYNIYRNNEVIAQVENTSYTDSDLVNNQYSYTITSNYNSGESEPTAAQSTLIEFYYSVTNLTVDAINSDLYASWEINPLAGESIVEFQLFKNGSLVSYTENTNFNFTSNANGTYDIAVKAVYDSGESDLSEAVTTVVDVHYPAENLDYSVTDNNVALAWQANAFATNVIEYQIYRDNEELAIVSDLSYTDSNLANGNYSYSIRAIYPNGVSEISNTVVAMVEVLYAPRNLTLTIQANSVTLNWDEPNSLYRDFIGYKLFRDEDLISSLTELTYTDSDLVNDQYSYTVKAEYSTGDSEASNVVIANVEVLYPALDLALNISEDDVTLTWDYNALSGTSIIDYTIYKDGLILGNVTDLTYLDQALANGVYEYNVSVNYLSGSSELAQAVSALVEVLYPPQNLNCIVENNSVLVTWDAAPTSSRAFLGYKLYRDNELIFFDETANNHRDLDLINDSYEYKLEAIYSTGTSEALTTSVIVEVLYPVVNFTGNLTETEINLAWENAPNAGNSVLSYSIYRNSELYANQTELTYSDSALPNGDYEYTVVANYASGSASASESLDFMVEITYPVTNLTAQVTADAVNLAWNLPVDSPRALLEYNIYRDGVFVGSSEELNYSDTGLANANYTYYVTAVYTSGESQPSNSVEAMVEVTYPVQNLVSSVEENNVTLTWDTPATSARGLLGYTILRDNEEIANTPENNYIDSNLLNNTYTFAVKALYSTGESIEVTTTALVEVLYPVINLTLDIFEDDATLAWETNIMSNTSIIDYSLYRNGINIGNSPEISYLDEMLANGSYEYYVVANYQTGSSEPSQSISALVEVLYAPENLTCLVENNNVLVSWDPAPTSARGFLGYKLSRDDQEIFFSEDATSYNDMNLINNEYEYKLEATYSTGVSEAVTTSVLIEILYPVIDFTGSLSETEVTLAWTNDPLAGTSIISYSVYRNGELYTILTDQNYVDPGLANATYDYNIIANYNTGSASLSESLSFNVEITYPVTNLTAQVTADLVYLSWDLPVNSPRALLSYNIYRDGVVVGNSEELYYSDTLLPNATYSYYITAVYTSGESEPSNDVEAMVEVLYPVENLTYSVTEDNVTLDWDEIITYPRSFQNYFVYRDDEEIAQVTTTTYIDSNLLNGSYDYYVVANYTTGTSQPSNSVQALVEVLYPANNFTGSLINDQVTLEWDSPSELSRDFLGYNIYRNNELVDATTQTQYVDSNLANGSHSYYVTATYSSGESIPTDVVEFFVEIPYPVTSLWANIDENNVILSWEIPVTSAQIRAFRGYFIYRNNAIATVIDNPETTSWTDVSLANGDYEYYLKAVYDAGISVESNHVNVSVEVLPDLFAPANLQLFVEDTNDVHLTWDIPSNEVINYLIFRDDSEIATSEDNSYWDYDLLNGSYHYYVKASYPEGVSSPSNSVIANIAATDIPNNLTADVINENDVVLTWEAPNNGETAFIINRNSQEIAYLSDVTQVDYTDQHLTNALHTYTIRAVYNHLISETSNPVYVDVMKLHTPEIASYHAEDNQISITWHDLSGWGRLIDYTVFKNGEEVGNTSDLYYSEADLTNGEYDFTVRANFDFGASPESSPANFMILLAQMVTNLSSIMIENDLVLSWDYPEDTGLISSYKVLRNNEVIATTQENTYTDLELLNGIYSYQIMTFYNDNITNPVTPVLEVSHIQAYPVTNLTANIDGQTIVVTWNSPLDMYGFLNYKVFRNEQFIMTLYSENNGFVDNIPTNGLYQYTIRSTYQNNQIVTAQTEALNFIVPVIPTNLTVSADDTVNLTWDFTGTDYGVMGFDVYNGADLLATTLDSNFELNISNGNYDFQVRTNYSEVFSDFSDILNYELIKTYPVTNADAQVIENDVSLNWNTPSELYGLANITLIRTQNNETNRLEVVLEADATSYTDQDLANGIYNYNIIANYNSEIQNNQIVSINDVQVIYAMPATDLAVTTTDNNLSLTWTEPEDSFGLINYEIYQNDTFIGSTEDNEYLLADQANGDYSFTVSSVYVDQVSAISEVLDYTLIIAYPAQNLATSITGNNVLLSWDAPNDSFGSVGYNLYALNANDIEDPELWLTVDTLITDTSLSDDISHLISCDYRWAVVSVFRNNQTDITLYSYPTFSNIITENDVQDIVAVTSINGNYPNPFNPETRISFQIANDSYVSMGIYNIKGQLVKKLVNGQLKSGNHVVTWLGKDDREKPVSSGVYFIRLSNNGNNIMKSCTLMK